MDGVVVTADPSVANRRKTMTYGSFTIKFPDAVTTASHASIATFKFNIQKSIEQADVLTMETLTKYTFFRSGKHGTTCFICQG